jgi:hypothetical protein
MAIEPNTYLVDALKEAEPELSNLWFSISDKFGWDKQASSLVKVTTSESGASLSYEPDMAQKVFDTEYGYKDSAPKPAMRELANVSQNTLSNAVYKGLSKYLKASGVIK